MAEPLLHQAQLDAVLPTLTLPPDIQIRCWTTTDMPAIQRLAELQGWPTQHTPEQVLASWRNAWPAVVATKNAQVIGYVRGLTDGCITTYIADLLVDSDYRGQGIGRLLLEICHLLYPNAYLILVAEKTAVPFYEKVGFKADGDCFYKWVR